MNIRQIQSFIAVADTKSFSEAAQLMYTSVSQISKLVKGFEEELGQVFFERKKNGVVLTLEGMKIYNVASKILKDIDELEFIKERRGKESFTVLGLPDMCLDNVFVAFLNDRKDQECFYNLSYKSIDNVSQELHVRKADLGFAYIEKIRLTAMKMRLKDYALSFTPVAKTKPYVFINKKHPLSKNESISPRQLETMEQIKINGNDFLNSEIKNNNDMDVYSRPAIKMVTYSLSTAMNTVANTDLVYIGCDIFDHWEKTENICRIPFENGEEETEFGYIKRHNIEISETAKDFLDYLEERLKR